MLTSDANCFKGAMMQKIHDVHIFTLFSWRLNETFETLPLYIG